MSSYNIENDKIEENIKSNEEKSIQNNNFLEISNINIKKNLDNNIEEDNEDNKDKSIYNNNSLKVSNINKECELKNNIEKNDEKIKSNEDNKIENNNSLRRSNINIENNLDNNIEEDNETNKDKSIYNNNSLKASKINKECELKNNIEKSDEIIKSNEDYKIENNNSLRNFNINIENNLDNNIEENNEFNNDKSIQNNNSLKASNIYKESDLDNNIEKIEENIKSNEDMKIENNNSLGEFNFNNENNFENNNNEKSSNIYNNNSKIDNSYIIGDNKINNIRNNFQNESLNLSQSINNPILIQLIDFGYDPIYSKRIIQYYHPLNVEEALEYLNFNQGIIQHRFIKDRNINNINCYVCGERKEIHLDYNHENEKEDNNFFHGSDINNIDIKKSYIFESIEINNIELNFNHQKICEICSETFIPSDENTVKECGHSYCNSCWYDYFSAQIQENKLTSIKCLNYECQEKLNDEFIIHLLNNNNELIKKYKKYKLEYEILNNPNKKNCPFPNCDSYLELKDQQNKYVTCLNNHTFCFLCLQKPHGKLGCNQKLDNSMVEFEKNNFVKKCPNCNIITEKSSGCNHMTCTKCKYQWCWLCNGKYTTEHYLEGKCRGYQFFKPKDENEIRLALEGKINLRDSQRQIDINYDVETGRHLRRRIYMDRQIRRYGCGQTSLIFIMYLIIGHSFYSLISMPNNYMRNSITIILICASYFFLEISNFFPMIYFNIIMLLPYLISHGFYGFIHYCRYFYDYSKQTKLYYTILLLVLNIFFGGFFHMLSILYNFTRRPKKYVQIIFFFISIMFEIIYFQIQLISNLIILLILLIKRPSRMIRKLSDMVENITGIQFIRDEH